MPEEKLPMTPTDNELVHQAQRGDQAAFEQLVFRHDKHVFSLAAQYVTSADDAKDIFQEVFIRAYRGLKSFEQRSEFSTWLHRIAVNVCLNHRARSRSSTHLSLNDENEGEIDEAHPALFTGGSADKPDKQTMEAEVASRIQDALASLSPKQRMVFTLKHMQGYRLREIAEMMDCAEGTIKRYLFDATARMRECLKDMMP